jgi:hypothetical protein
VIFRGLIVGIVTALAIVIVGCSEAAEDTTTTTTSATTTSLVDATATTMPDPGTESTTTTAMTPVGPLVIAGLDPIEQLTPVSGEGSRPLLVWAPVDGAAAYLVMVYDGDDLPYWSTITSDTQTYVGGPLQIPDDRSGPRISEGYSWSVYADDADGTIIAASPLRDIAP